jgi:hypothetical protein
VSTQIYLDHLKAEPSIAAGTSVSIDSTYDQSTPLETQYSGAYELEHQRHEHSSVARCYTKMGIVALEKYLQTKYRPKITLNNHPRL